MEMTTFIGAIFGFVAIILVIFLYIHRKWCFNTTSRKPCCDQTVLTAQHLQKLGIYQSYSINIIVLKNCVLKLISIFFSLGKSVYDTNITSSDSEEEILRRLRLQQSCSLQSGQLSRYSDGPLNSIHNLNLGGLQHVTFGSKDVARDPLAIAERGKVGMPPSSSETSSSSSVDASYESNVGLINLENKGLLVNHF